MLCEKCKKRTAAVFYNENINGKTRSFSLCSECAARLREKGDLQDITSMVGSFADPFSELQDNLFGGFFGLSKPQTLPGEKTCPGCNSTYADILKDGKVGCPECYSAFSSELSRMIRSIHGTTAHTGAIPARHRARQEREEHVKQLRKDLQEAIKKEDFESAARLRDEIRAAEAQNDSKEGE